MYCLTWAENQCFRSMKIDKNLSLTVKLQIGKIFPWSKYQCMQILARANSSSSCSLRHSPTETSYWEQLIPLSLVVSNRPTKALVVVEIAAIPQECAYHTHPTQGFLSMLFIYSASLYFLYSLDAPSQVKSQNHMSFSGMVLWRWIFFIIQLFKHIDYVTPKTKPYVNCSYLG